MGYRKCLEVERTIEGVYRGGTEPTHHRTQRERAGVHLEIPVVRTLHFTHQLFPKAENETNRVLDDRLPHSQRRGRVGPPPDNSLILSIPSFNFYFIYLLLLIIIY